MEKNKIQEEIIKIVMNEYNVLREEIRLIIGAIIRDFQIFLGFLAAIFALSIKGSTANTDIINIQIIISFIPYLFFAFSFFFLIKMSNLMINAAYIRNIEKRINIFFETKVLNWESSITPNLLFRYSSTFILSSILFSVLLLIGYIVASYLGYYYYIPKHEFLKNYKNLFGIMYIACPILFLVFIVLIFSESKKLAGKIEDLIKGK